MTFSPNHVANTILKKAFDEGVEVSPMKLQKILYFVASEYAKEKNKPLLAEPFQPWRYGPVVRSVYDEFRPYGGKPIKTYAKDSTGKAYVVATKKNGALSRAIDRVWEATKDESAVQLSRITHLRGSGWFPAYQRRDQFMNDEEIQSDVTYRGPLGLS